MELLQLQYFCDAAESQNFSATAQKFMVPPSAVSQSIKRLETELSVQLFHRSANRVRLCEQGRAFYEKAKQALELLEDAKKEVGDDGERGSIRLSIFINRRIVMQTVEKFSRLYPQVDIVTKYTVSPEREHFDLTVTDVAPGAGDYIRESLIEEEIRLAVHRDSPLAKGELTVRALAQAPFICTNQGSSLHRIAQEISGEMGFTPRIVICSDDPYYIRKCIEMGLGVAFVPARSWQGQFSENVVMRRIGDYHRATYAYRSRQKYFPKCVARFLELLRAEFAGEQET